MSRVIRTESVIRDYYCYLDHEIGRCLELLDDDTVVAVVSDHGAQRLDGGFCVNEWLIRQGLLVLNNYPTEVTPFGRLSVDWSKTTAWSEGGTTRGSSSTSKEESHTARSNNGITKRSETISLRGSKRPRTISDGRWAPSSSNLTDSTRASATLRPI